MATFFRQLHKRVKDDFDNLLCELSSGALQKSIKAELLNTDPYLQMPNETDREEITSHIIMMKFKDKEAVKEHYRQNLCCFFETINLVLKKTKDKTVLQKLCEALFFDLVLLIQDYRGIVLGDSVEVACWRRSASPCIELYRLSSMMIYGGVDRDIGDKFSIVLVIMREIIETKFRRAFGAYAIVDANGKEYPLNMQKIFNVVDKYKNQIKFAIPFDLIRKIYEFCNVPVHCAYIPFQWVPIFLKDMIRAFACGVPLANGAYNIDSGIITTQETINAIRDEIEKGIQAKEVKEKKEPTRALSKPNGEYMCHIVEKI